MATTQLTVEFVKELMAGAQLIRIKKESELPKSPFHKFARIMKGTLKEKTFYPHSDYPTPVLSDEGSPAVVKNVAEPYGIAITPRHRKVEVPLSSDLFIHGQRGQYSQAKVAGQIKGQTDRAMGIDLAAYFNNCTDASNYPIADGLAFASTAHTLKKSTSTTSNLVATAAQLSPAGVNAVQLLGWQNKDHQGSLEALDYNILLVGPAKGAKAKKICLSKEEHGTADHSYNDLKKLEPIIWNQLTGTTQYQLVAYKERNGIVIYKNMNEQVEIGKNKHTGIVYFVYDIKYGIGITDHRGVAFDTGA